MAHIEDFHRGRLASVEIGHSFHPQTAAYETVRQAHVQHGKVRIAYVTFDHPSQSFVAVEMEFEVENGEPVIETIRFL